MGFGAEGDWKVAGLAAVMKRMGEGVGKGGTAFMEDYTLNLEKGNEFIMGAHMLEVDPTVAATKPTIEVHPLGIGGKADPARLVFDGKGGEAICCSLVDMGGRLRLICNDVVCMQPDVPMPKLPVARCLWKPLPSQPEAAEAWIYAGGSHHSVLSFDLTAEQMHDWADMNGIEFVHIGKDLDMDRFKQRLFVNDMAFKLR